MLGGEPSWLAAFEPAAESIGSGAGPLLSFPATRSGYVLHVWLGEELHRPAVAERDDAAVILDGVLLDRGPLLSACGSRRLGGIEGGAEFVLAAYLEIGERALPLLRGSCGLVIWDSRTETVLCARDPTDSHPLFFSRTGNGVLVSASHGALLGAGRVSPEVDRLAVARWVLQGATLPRRTFYARIERLPPGYVLTAAPGRLEVRRYWHPGDKASADPVTPEDAVERLEELLDQAVERCASRGRLGVFLSGGVDSAVVAASATVVSRAGALPDPLALSYVPPDPEASEERVQRSVADGLGIPRRIVRLRDTVGGEGLLVAALRLTERAWMPCVNPWEPAFVHLAEQGAELGCRVILSGEGGNDWFEAQWYEAADLLRRLRLVGLWRLWSQERRAGRSASETTRGLLWRYGARPLLRDATLAVLRQVAEGTTRANQRRRILASVTNSWAIPDGDLRSALVDELLEMRSIHRPGSHRDSANERKLEGVHLVVPMENRFLFSRTTGVHFLNPAVDPDLVEYLYALPSALINLDGRGKGLAWESVRRRTPGEAAGLLGFAGMDKFFARLVRTEGPPALEELGGLRELSALGIVDERAFGQALTGPRLGVELSFYEAWQVLACEAWLR